MHCGEDYKRKACVHSACEWLRPEFFQHKYSAIAAFSCLMEVSVQPGQVILAARAISVLGSRDVLRASCRCLLIINCISPVTKQYPWYFPKFNNFLKAVELKLLLLNWAFKENISRITIIYFLV